MSTYYDLLEEFVNDLFRDRLLSDDLSTRFEVWGRVNKLDCELRDIINDEAEETAQSLAEEMDMDESEEMLRVLRDLVEDLEEDMKGRERARKTDIRSSIRVARSRTSGLR